MNFNDRDLAKNLIASLEENAEQEDGKKAKEFFRDIVFQVVKLWAANRNNDPVWPPGFQEQVATLIRRPGNRWGFQIYFSECQRYGMRSMTDGFNDSCLMRSKIQVIIDNFVPFSDLVHPDDVEDLEMLDDFYTENADEIVPISAEEIPSWIPESHWWWQVPTRHDMSQREIHEKLYDYHLEDWDN